MLALVTPTISFAQTKTPNYSNDQIISEALVIKPEGSYVFDVKKAISMGMSKENALEAQKSFDSLGSYVKSNSDLPRIDTKSKGSVAIKASIDYMKAHKTKINNAIHAGIDKIPFVKKATKNKWKAAITVGALTKAMSHYIDFADSVEDAISRAITDISPIPKTVADIIAKTISLFLPI